MYVVLIGAEVQLWLLLLYMYYIHPLGHLNDGGALLLEVLVPH